MKSNLKLIEIENLKLSLLLLQNKFTLKLLQLYLI